MKNEKLPQFAAVGGAEAGKLKLQLNWATHLMKAPKKARKVLEFLHTPRSAPSPLSLPSLRSTLHLLFFSSVCIGIKNKKKETQEEDENEMNFW